MDPAADGPCRIEKGHVIAADPDLLLHPVRIRIVQALVGRERTTSQLRAELADVPTATLYRHVGRLVDGGVLEVAAMQSTGGPAARVYRLVAEAAQVGPAEAAAIDPEAYLRYLSAFLGAVIERAGTYLASPDIDAVRDGFGFSQAPIWATDEEFEAFAAELGAALQAAVARGPGAGRRRRLLTTVLVPDPPGGEGDGGGVGP